MATIQLEKVTKVFPTPPSVLGWIVQGKAEQVANQDEDAHVLPGRVAGRNAVANTGVRRTAKGVVALDEVDLTIHHGETMSVIGPSGCGKTTLLRVIAGLEPVTSGRVLYDNQDMARVPPGDRGIGIVFQNYALYPHMTSKNNLAFYFWVHKREDEVDERVKVTAEMLGVGFDLLLDRKPPTLSAGQKQRVALGRCIVRDPKLILLDEPLSNLDAKLRVQTRGELKRLLRHFEVTAVYVTHDQTEAIALADRLAVMRWGRIEQVGSYWDIYRRPANTFVAGFVGTPPMNFLRARIRLDGVEVAGGESLIAFPRERYLPIGRSVTLGIRPEDISLARDDPAAIYMVADMVEYLPSDRCYIVYGSVGGARVTARLKSENVLARGERLPLRMDLENASYFDPDTGERLV